MLAVVDALLPGLRAGALVIDCSTVSADTAREAARRLAAQGGEFLDAPVSGGVEGARDGTLAIMAGGTESAFARAQPVLQAMGRTVTHFGPSGSGQAAKATNQIMCAGVIQAVAEAMAFAKSQGLPLPQLIETLGKGAGSSWYFVNRAPNIVRDAFPAGFRVRLHEKDLQICRDMAAQFGVELPVVEATLAQYHELIAQGHGDEDISVLFRLKDALFAAALRSPAVSPPNPHERPGVPAGAPSRRRTRLFPARFLRSACRARNRADRGTARLRARARTPIGSRHVLVRPRAHHGFPALGRAAVCRDAVPIAIVARRQIAAREYRLVTGADGRNGGRAVRSGLPARPAVDRATRRTVRHPPRFALAVRAAQRADRRRGRRARRCVTSTFRSSGAARSNSRPARASTRCRRGSGRISCSTA